MEMPKVHTTYIKIWITHKDSQGPLRVVDVAASHSSDLSVKHLTVVDVATSHSSDLSVCTILTLVDMATSRLSDLSVHSFDDC